MATDYNLLGSTEVLEELQEGRTRELLLLLQDKTVPEVVDPLNLQSGLSNQFSTDENGDYQIDTKVEVIDDFEDNNLTTKSGEWDGWNDLGSPMSVTSTNPISDSYSGFMDEYTETNTQGPDESPNKFRFSFRISNQTGESLSGLTLYLRDGGVSGNVILKVSLFGDGSVRFTGANVNSPTSWDSSTTYTVELSFDWSNDEFNATFDGTTYGPYNFSNAASHFDNVKIFRSSMSGEFDCRVDDIEYDFIQNTANVLDGYVTDQFTTPTTEPADFQQWNAIQARNVTTGGSTSADPVEFEILDSTDTVLNSSRIPKAQIADEPFTMRNRVYSEDAGSDGQSDYQIATTGDGGHFGFPILTVVSVKKNGSVLDSANWSFDGTDTVTIDTSKVTIASGDTIEIKYDFDVFDSTLQPRAYLSREDTSEASPSISHFRYEYVI